jgi:hypothetical protein
MILMTTMTRPTMTDTLTYLKEPRLTFGHQQDTDDPRDGLTLFGPLDEGKPYGIRAGVIGSSPAIERFNRWVHSIQRPVISARVAAWESEDKWQKVENWERARPPYPGFETVFGIPWSSKPAVQIEVTHDELSQALYITDREQRVFKTVEVYSRRITDSHRENDASPDVWYVIIPEEIHKYCRPLSRVARDLAVNFEPEISVEYLKQLADEPSLYVEENVAALPYQYEPDFHNQLKARLLGEKIPTQIVREKTIAPAEILSPRKAASLAKQAPEIAWTLSTSAFYKTGGRPWKLSGIREGVCYIGLVFKRDHTSSNPRSACCAAQMFLDSGDGLVFKGDVGPWYAPDTGEFHLDRRSAKELVDIAVKSYADTHDRKPPRELFIHGRVRFNEEEWAGFLEGRTSETNAVGIRIREERGTKLFRRASHPILRGLAYVRDERTAFLWTRGYIPRLRTYPGREVPNPLMIDVCRGTAPIETVLRDILALTKVNYNSCIFADGVPVTLRFAENVGEILTAGPAAQLPPLQFRYYI